MDIQALMPQPGTQKKRLCCKKKKSAPWLEGTLGTEYRLQYIEKEVPQQRQSTNVSGFPTAPPARFEGLSTMMADFKPFQTERTAPIKPQQRAADAQPFNGESLYKAEYGPKEVPYSRVRPTNNFEANKGPFYGTTTHAEDFKMRGVPQPAQQVIRPVMATSAGPFEGTSAYKDQFKKWPGAARRAAVVPRGGELASGPFEDGTVYRTAYVPREVAAPERARPQERPRSSAGWVDGSLGTEYRGQFINKEVPVAPTQHAARGALQLPSAPFEGTTTAKADFVPFAVERTAPIRPTAAARESAPFQGETSYASNFTHKDVPYARVKPTHAFQPNAAPFQGETTHQAAFREVSVPVAPRKTHDLGVLGRDKHPFQGASTYKDNFKKNAAAKRTPCLPTKGGVVQSGPFDGTTTYRVDYIPKEATVERAQGPCDPCDSECESCYEEAL